MSAPPKVSVIVPCRNEEVFLRRALESLWANDYPKDRIDILVVDGMSSDRSREVVAEFGATHSGLCILDNPKKSVPAAMNVGIMHARGEVILKADAHAIYPREYISRCVKCLYEYGADNAGGVLIYRPPDNTLVSRAIALVLSHPLGSGNAPHLRVSAGKPRLADSTAFGCYRSDVFSRVGLFNEELLRSSDLNLNHRIRSAGGKVMVIPDLLIEYYPRPGFYEFLRRNFYVGYW